MFPGICYAGSSDYFQIVVEDASTGRGVPLVELRTVNEVRYYTDSNGIVAIADPELMGQRVFFTISSPGYSSPKDEFGYSGVALAVTPGGRTIVKVTRDNIAERIYRITGAGIYRDSILVGRSAPIKHPLLDGLVMGQDTVMVASYNSKLYWFFGDTNRPSYPLGQFAISGATSEFPNKGGLDPSQGIDLNYWVDSSGFSRPMIPMKDSPGPVWIGGLFTMQDGGHEKLFAHYVEVNHDQSIAQSGLAEFDDAKAVFLPVCKYPDGDPLHPEGEPFRVTEASKEYIYFETQEMGAFPLVRNAPNLKAISDSTTYEGFTCLAPGTRYAGENTQLDRAADGHLAWGWKKNTPALGEDQESRLVTLGKMKQEEVLTQLRDIETDSFVTSHGGSVFWNPYRNRWILITTQAYGSPSFLGEVWFAEADTPVGPWLYARKVATHDHYTFYNPTQHPFFDQQGGRVIYFEGTYTDTYSGVKDLTPRYNYNQLMYRLSLNDARLALPAPVYLVKRTNGTMSYEMKEQLDASNEWVKIQSIPFYAVPASRPHDGLVPIYASQSGALQLTPTASSNKPLCYALPAGAATASKESPSVVPLCKKSIGGIDTYHAGIPGADEQPLCRVWRNPSSLIALDYDARPEAIAFHGP